MLQVVPCQVNCERRMLPSLDNEENSVNTIPDKKIAFGGSNASCTTHNLVNQDRGTRFTRSSSALQNEIRSADSYLGTNNTPLFTGRFLDTRHGKLPRPQR